MIRNLRNLCKLTTPLCYTPKSFVGINFKNMESLDNDKVILSFLTSVADGAKTAKEISDELKKLNKDLTKKQVNQVLDKLEKMGVVKKSGNSQPPKWTSCKGESSTLNPQPKAKVAKMSLDSVSDGASPHFRSPSPAILDESALTQKIEKILKQSGPLTAPEVSRKLNDPSMDMKSIRKILYNCKGFNNIALEGQKPRWTLSKTSTTVSEPSVLAGKQLYTREEQDGKITFTQVRSSDIMPKVSAADVVGETSNMQYNTDVNIQEEVKSKPKSKTSESTEVNKRLIINFKNSK